MDILSSTLKTKYIIHKIQSLALTSGDVFYFIFFLSAPPPLSDTIFFRISCEIMYVLFTNLQSVINKKEIMRVCMYVSMLHTHTHAHAHTHTHDGN